MQHNIKKKFTKVTSIGLAGAMLLCAMPLNFVDAAEIQNPTVVNTQEVAQQALQSYLADANGLFTAKATAETVNLPFSGELYYGRSLLTNEKAKQAWDVIIRELLAFDPNVERTGVTYTVLDSGVGSLTIDLQELGVNVASFYVSDLRNNLVNSDPRLFYLNGGQGVKSDADGTARSVTFYVQAGYAKDSKYQETLLAMEERASEILSVVDERMTDAQKVAAIYNKFCSMTKYVKNSGHWIMTGPLLEGGGICGGYSYAFQYLLQRAGIEAIYTTGDTELGYHAWNYMKVDGEWYFADSTWGGNKWLLKGQSSLNSHRRYNTFSTMPKLAEKDYDLKATVFSVEKYNETVAKETYDMTVSVIRDVLNNHADELAQIDQIYMFEPTTFEYVGNEVEEAIADEIREAVTGNFTGTLAVTLTNFGEFTTVDEFMTEGLSVGYQASDDTPYYFYTSEGVTVYN